MAGKSAETQEACSAPGGGEPRPLRTPAALSRRCAQTWAMRCGGVRTFTLELARGPGDAYRGGERLCGLVLLEAAAPLRVRALEVAARGGAATHWLEGRSVGINAVSSDFAAAETYLRRRQQLLGGELLTTHPIVRILWHPLPRSARSSPERGALQLRGRAVSDPSQEVGTSSPGSVPSQWDSHPLTPSKKLFPGNPSQDVGYPFRRGHPGLKAVQ